MSERVDKEEFKRQLKERTKAFAVSVFKLVDQFPKLPSTQVISFQLGKSASSIGANYREASRAESRADFVHKIGIAEKEADETLFWLEVLADLYPESHALHQAIIPLLKESDELVRLFSSINRSAKSTQN
jgi:four helix bundle protein